MANEKQYDITVNCQNCGANNSIAIPRGTTIKDFVQVGKILCTNCGCIARDVDSGLSALEAKLTP